MESSPLPDVPQLLQEARDAIARADYAGAFAPLQSVLQYDAGQRSAWFTISELCLFAEHFDAAETAATYALSLEPRDSAARMMRARARLMQRAFDAALQDLDWLVSERLVGADDEDLLWLRSDILYGQTRYQWALDDINEVVSRAPHNEESRRWRDEMMRRLLACSQDAEEIAAHLSALLAREEAAQNGAPTDDVPPLNPRFDGWEKAALWVSLALAYENAGRESDADDIMATLCADYDGDAYACVNVAEIEFRRRNLAPARYWANRAIALNHTYGGSHFLLAQIEEEIARRERGQWLEERVLQGKLIGAHLEYPPALEWMQAQWQLHFSWMGEVNFLHILETEARPQDAEWNAPPTATNWDEIVGEFKAQDEDEPQ